MKRYLLQCGGHAPWGPWLVILWAVSSTTAAHELPDGVVERAIQVTALPEHVEVRYQFGMSENTMREQLTALDKPPEADLSALEAQLLEVIGPAIPELLLVELDQQRLQANRHSGALIYLHHLQFEYRMEYVLAPATDTGIHRLSLQDQNFADRPGHFRVAVRGRDGVDLESDDAAPILVRSPRVAVQGDERGRMVGPSLTARLQLPQESGHPSLSPQAAEAQTAASQSAATRSAATQTGDNGSSAETAAPEAGDGQAETLTAPAPTPVNGPRVAPVRGVPFTLVLVVAVLIGIFCLPLILAKSRRVD